MNNLLILNKENYDILIVKNFDRGSLYNAKEFDQTFFVNIIEIVKDMDQIGLNQPEYYIFKFDSKKNVIYRCSKESKFSILIICDRKSIKKASLIEISKYYLQHFEANFSKNIEISTLSKKNNTQYFNTKDYTKICIENLTVKFIEDLRKSKLYAKFIYYNFNPSVSCSLSYKKSKCEPNSVILYNSNSTNVEKM